MKLKLYRFSLLMALIAMVFIAEASILSANISADFQPVNSKIQKRATPKYVIFNNMDAISDSAYYIPIQQMPEYKDDFISLSFSNSTFETYKITDFDLAIFPIGDNALNTATDSKLVNVIISKIKEMIDAGKKVIIFSRRALWYAFNTDPLADGGKDPSTILFLSNTLGIQYLSTFSIAVTQGLNTTYSGFVAKGTAKDPIGVGNNKPCNIKVGNDILMPNRFGTIQQ